jgi:hypothetical protein
MRTSAPSFTLSPRACPAHLAVLGALAAPAAAQQFQQATNFPGTALWSEGVEACDVDRDGDLDLFVADGGNFNSAGVARQNLLWINQTVQGTPFGLVDESIARLGVHTSHAKGVTTGDIDGDGWEDALFVNAFFTSPPHLYENRGAAQPGYFDFTGAARGLTTNLSSGAGMFADLDDDGDLDLVLNDRYNSSTAAPMRLYVNDGAGNFTDSPALLNSPSRAQQMDVQIADIDGDWDLDVIGINKGGANAGQILLQNDGTGTFAEAPGLLVVGGGSVYEAEIGDLDGDDDLDLFFTSMSGFAEGVTRNNLAQNGTLSFTNLATFGGDDDNEIAFFDYDMDGDYDAFVGSLRNGSEKLYRNDGNLVFSNQSAQIQNTADSTLDLTPVDLNNDGRYDLVTVQGESGSFVNKYLVNTGPVDNRPPVFTAVRLPPAPGPSGPWVVKARIRDQVLDDGVDYLTGTSTCVVQAAPLDLAVTIGAGGSFSAPNPAVGAGTKVTFTNNSGASVNLACQTGPYAFVRTLASGEAWDVVLVEAGSYPFANLTNGTTCDVAVSGATLPGLTRKSGPQLWRYDFQDTLGGAAARVCFELRSRDWPGNVRAVTGWFDLSPGAVGTGYCFGDGSATACPCGNAGAAGRGCGSSVNAAGARLAASGLPSLSADGVVLAGSGMPNSSALYFQGTARTNGGLGQVFGDGLRCAGGSVVRLGTKANAAGASSYPGPGDLSVSVRGAVAAPGTRTYQVWYRNAAAFCTADTFNLSNGLEIVWGA